jgi:hypothetical protein
MTPTEDNGCGTRITLHFPGNREHVWGSGSSGMLQWQIGDVIQVRGSHWLVVGRDEEHGSLIFSFAERDGTGS